MSDADNLSDLETIWADLRGLLEWQEGFGLYLIFSQDVGVARSLLRSLTRWCEEHMTRIQVVRPAKSTDALARVLAALAGKSNLPSAPLWLEFDLRTKDGGWNIVRRQLLTALNQRRSWLEQEFRRPLFIHLPYRFAAELVTWAPDLWSVKRYTAVLPSKQPVLSIAEDLAEEDRQTVQTDINLDELAEKYHVSVPQQGRPQTIRDLAVYIANGGNNNVLGYDGVSDLVCALDSLSLFRFLRKLFGDTPQLLIDVSDALRRVARAKKVDQNYIGAIKALHAALGLRQRLLTRAGDPKEVLPVLITIQNELAILEKEVGNRERARAWLKSSQTLKARLTESKQLRPIAGGHFSGSHYHDNARSVMAALPLKTQAAIEFVRVNILPRLINSQQARVANNMVFPVEYWNDFPSYDFRLFYYEEYGPPHEIVIHKIEHPVRNGK
jgi:hypothetical protein